MEKKDLLVVEDSPDTAAVFEAFFTLLPYDCVLTNTAEEAVALIKTTTFKVFILDINLGKSRMHGVDLSLLLRKECPEAKIYAITGHMDLFSNIDPSVAGFDGVFYKSHDYSKILKQIKEDLK